MNIFYCGILYDKYDSGRGPSFEHENFYLSLENYEGVRVKYFPFDGILEKGKKQWNSDLLSAVREEKPDLVFFFMLSDELDKKVLRQIKKETTTLAWFADDHWRFDNYSRVWAACFTWVVTTYSKAVRRYKKIGVRNVIRSQWAANVNIYKPVEGSDILPYKERPDVTFVGGWSKPRQKIISYLEKRGIKVDAYGSGWPGGRVSQEEMIRIISVSKINLGLNPAPGYFNKNSLGRLGFCRSVNKIVPDFHMIRNLRSWAHRGIPQIKGRHFEVPACRGFMITSRADDIERYYFPDKEIAIYKNLKDLVEKINYYLEHDDERDYIAQRGYERTLKDHTYEKRFDEIFNVLFNKR